MSAAYLRTRARVRAAGAALLLAAAIKKGHDPASAYRLLLEAAQDLLAADGDRGADRGDRGPHEGVQR